MKRTLLAGLQREIGEGVTRARRKQGLTQQSLARKMRTRQANISRIERGMQNLSLDLLLRLNDTLHLGLKLTVR